jgi:hypothetical protein
LEAAMDFDLGTAKDIATIVAPLSAAIIKTWVEPKLATLAEYLKTDKALFQHSLSGKFEEYLLRTYEKNSFISVLVFQNQQKKLDDIYIPLTLEKARSDERIRINSYEPEFIPAYEKVLIRDTAGMGKSTLMKRLFLSSVDGNKGVPIFIELRKLRSDFSVLDYIYNELNPIDDEFDRDFILKLIKQGDFIFFLDGFDEIPFQERDRVTTGIQDFIFKASNNLFALTSRPESALASFSDFQDFNIRPLESEEAYTLLRKYDNSGKLSEEIISKIKGSTLHNIREFLTNPLLVSLLFKSYEYKRTIPFKKHIFYRQVYDALFESHDLTKGGAFVREKHSGLDVEDFHRVLRAIGFITIKLGQLEFEKDRWLNLIAEAKRLCPGIDFKEGRFLNDVTTTVPLFNRDGDYYRWAHKSVQEYFAAQFICVDSKGRQDAILRKMAENRNILKFLNVIDLCYDIDYKTFRKVVIFDLLSEFLQFYEASYVDIDRGEISESDIDIRKAIMFQVFCGFLRPSDTSADDSVVSQNIERYMKDESPSLEDYDLWMVGGSPSSFLYFTHKRELFDLLAEKDEDIFIGRSRPQYFDEELTADHTLNRKIEEYVSSNGLLVVTDDPTSIVNDKDTFNYVSWQFSDYLGSSLDPDKAFKLLKTIQREITEEAADTFLIDSM